jgi:hypothetical protein
MNYIGTFYADIILGIVSDSIPSIDINLGIKISKNLSVNNILSPKDGSRANFLNVM